MSETTGVRGFVPSAREVAGGAVPSYEYTAAGGARVAARVPLRDRVRGYLQQADPRAIRASAGLLPVVVFMLVFAFVQMETEGFAVLLPDIQNTFNLNAGFIITFTSLVFGISIGLGPLFGYLADRVRRVWMLRAGSLAVHGFFTAGGSAGSVGSLVSTRSGSMAGGPLISAVVLPLLSDYYPPRVRARAFAFFYVCIPVGLAIGPGLFGGLDSWLGWRGTMLVVGGVATLVSLSTFLLREPTRGALDRAAMGADEQAQQREQRPVSWSEGWRAASSIRTLRRVWYATPFTTVGASLTYTIASLHFNQHFQLDPAGIGLIISLGAVPGLLGLLFAGPFADRLLAERPGRYMTVMGVLLAMVGISYVGFVLIPILPLDILMYMIPAFVAMLIQPGQLTLTAMVVPSRIRGMGITSLAPFQLLGSLLGVIIGTVVGTQGLTVGLLLMVPITLAGAAIYATGAAGVEADLRAALASSMADEEARRARESGRNKLLICRGVEVSYDGAQVLFGVDFDVEEGELVALLGTNGAGKSTLLRAIAGVQQASNGAIYVDGDDLTHAPADQVAERGVVMMPGGRAVFPSLTVAENLRAAAWLHRHDEDEVRTQTEEVLDLFPELCPRLDTAAGNMSGGEQQMLALSQALLMQPRLLMIDELSLGLAPQVVERLLAVLRRIHAAGTTVIVVEQSINVALTVAERAVYMERGRVRFDGPTRELLTRDDVVHSIFLGGAVTSSLSGTSRAFGMIDEPERVLSVEHVAMRYGGVEVLRDVSLHVDAREVVGIIGANGAGKTTLFDVITGFATPAAGGVVLLDEDVTRLSADARARLGIARSYQNVRLFPALTVRENIAVALERHLQSRSAVLAAVWAPPARASERRVWRRVDNLVGSLGLGPYAGKFLNELSTGTRRIVDIACLLAAAPKLLLLDEPTSGLAQAETEMLAPVIDRIVAEVGCGILIIEHDLGLVAGTSDRLVAMRLGAVLAEGRPGDVLDDGAVIDSLVGGASDAVLSRSIHLVAERSTR
jgi:branched-chain amino acid transport system ATP-binding protein